MWFGARGCGPVRDQQLQIWGEMAGSLPRGGGVTLGYEARIYGSLAIARGP